MDIGQTIKTVIRSHGLTLEKVAQTMGVTKGTLSTTINGNPTIKKLEEISSAIGCSVSDFFVDEAVSLNGFVEYKGKVYKIKTIANIEELLQAVKGEK